MAVTVELTYDMSRVFGASRFELDDPATVADAVRLTRERFPEGGEAFEKLTRVAAVAVNGVLVKHKKGMKTALHPGDRLSFVKAAAGG